MKTSSEQREKRDVFDVRSNNKKTSSLSRFIKNLLYGRGVLNLKPGFRVRHPWVWGFGFCAVLIIVFLGVRQFSTHADVHDFSPTTCLGNWQNVANAEGDPETVANPNIPFSAANSAVYASDTEIYCGGFLPPSFATSGQITNVGLTLVWQIGDAPTSSAATSTTMETASITSASSTTSSSTATAATATTTSVSAGADTSSNATTPDLPPILVAPIASSSDSSSASTPVSTPTPTTTAVPDASSTSFIRQLIPFAFADSVSSGTFLQTTTTATAMASDTEGASTTIIVPPPVPDNNFLNVSYSTDGQTWISIGKVNMSNWQQFTVTLPLSDWTDLQNLQVRVDGIPTTQDPIPPIYLDGMFVEVHYNTVILPVPTDAASSTDATTSANPSSARMTLVNPGAQQACDVQPFSQELPLGGTAAFTVNLHPSINGVSYSLLLGHLPVGISAILGSPSGPIAATSSLIFQAETSTIPGSLNIVVIYQEHEEDGSVLSNFCQLNIDAR